MATYNIGDELSIRLLGHPIPYQLIAVIEGSVTYAIAEKNGDVDNLYYNRKSELSDEVYVDRKNKTFFLMTVTNPLATSMKIGQTLYVSEDLYDPALTTKSVEKEEFILSLRIEHDVVNGETTSIDDVVASISELLDSDALVEYDIRSNGTVVDTGVDESAVELEQLKKIVSSLLNLDVDKLTALATVDITAASNALAKLVDAYKDAIPN